MGHNWNFTEIEGHKLGHICNIFLEKAKEISLLLQDQAVHRVCAVEIL